MAGKRAMGSAKKNLAGVVVYCIGGQVNSEYGDNSAYTPDAALKSIGINGKP